MPGQFRAPDRDPDVLVVAKHPISSDQVSKVKRSTKADSVLQVDGARVKLGQGTTTAVGVDPSTFRNVAPDIPLRDVIVGVLPFVGLMVLAVILCCLLPGIVLAFPTWIMGGAGR